MPPQDPRIDTAVRVAREARERAYVPYSRFRMGAAVITDRGDVIPGALIENVSLGLAMCAERTALFASVTHDRGTPAVLALVSARTDGALTWPCGACLQVALELGGPDLLVIAAEPGGSVEHARLGDLAPRLPHKQNP